MSDIGGGAEALRGFPSLISIDPLRKWAKSLITLARPEGLESPTTWFEASGSHPPFSASVCYLLYIVVPTDFGELALKSLKRQ